MLAGALALSLLAASCGGSKSGESSNDPVDKESMALNAAAGESGLAEAGDPTRGGTLVYALEADSNDGWCLSSSQLAISGMMVARAVFDTLTMPNVEGDYVPYLAQDVTPNDDYTEWTITLREGVQFHDGSALDATVVKNNLDAYRGEYPGRSSALFTFVLKNIDTVEAIDDLTVVVTTETPWVSFPSYLYSSSRLGIMAQAQLDDGETCDRNPIGTGPFQFQEWRPNEKFSAVRNDNYWQIAPDGEPYPYADAIEFRPTPNSTVRNQGIESGAINIMHTSVAEDIAGKLRTLRDDGDVNMYVSEENAEVSFIQMNSARPPFDDIRVRRALAMASDRASVNERLNAGLPTLANGPFGPGSPGYLEDPGFPDFDVAAAEELLAEYRADNPGASPDFTLSSTTDPAVLRVAEEIQQRARSVGITVQIHEQDQAALITSAIAGDYQAMVFRNYPGGDPDGNYVWWHGGDEDGANLVNFMNFDDPDINRLLEEGRGEPDPDRRAEIYQEINRIFAQQMYAMWSWYTPWSIVTASNVHGILGPPLPGDDPSQPGEASTDDPARQPSLGLATGHSLLGLWVTN